ncbi:hypothetical protein M0Q50_03860 [bacterium]|jgi:hypothetical protein|nr:hypothetical protein [bacterium]
MKQIDAEYIYYICNKYNITKAQIQDMIAQGMSNETLWAHISYYIELDKIDIRKKKLDSL